MIVEILRGKEHIGGSILKITQGQTAILLDCGAMLPEVGQPATEDNFDLSRIGTVEAVFLTHHHGDHSGLLDKLPPEAALYASVETVNTMNTLDLYLDRPLRTAGRAVHGLFDGETAQVGELCVTAFAVEHSAEGAVMFLVEGGGKRLLYTGDYKNAEGIAPEGVDLLITEGTMLTRDGQRFPDEAAVETELRRVMRQTKGRVFILQSCTNLPRVQSVVAACKGTSRALMQDVFMRFSLEQNDHQALTARYGFVWNPFDQQGERFYDKLMRRYFWQKAAASCKHIADYPRAVVFIRSTMVHKLREMIKEGMNITNDAFVFSMWRGYEKEPRTTALVELFRANGVQPQYIHTSGHADRQHIRALIDVVKPKRICCIHSEDADGIAALAGEIEVAEGERVEV